MVPTFYYCFDALCGWCYGFSPVIRQLETAFRGRVGMEVLSGGMVLPENRRPVGVMADYILQTYPRIESMSGVRFGEDYLWHLRHPDQSDWALDSVMAATALCIFRDADPDRALEAAADIQYGHFAEGRDLTDGEAYRHLLPKYGLEPDDFYAKLKSEEYREKAYYDFALVKQLQVKGYPALLLQTEPTKFYLIASGYTDFETVKARVEGTLSELGF